MARLSANSGKPLRVEVAKLQEILDVYAAFAEPQRSASITWALEALAANPSRKLRKEIDDVLLAGTDDLLQITKPSLTAEQRAMLMRPGPKSRQLDARVNAASLAKEVRRARAKAGQKSPKVVRD